jgi:hypothetical protein
MHAQGRNNGRFMKFGSLISGKMVAEAKWHALVDKDAFAHHSHIPFILRQW